jgi:hypothetical protein
MIDDYQELGLGELTSLVTQVSLGAWGSQLSLRCLYDPAGERLPYLVTFHHCQQIQWNVHELELVADAEADLIGISLGKGDFQEPAVIYTDIFELSIVYSSFTIQLLEGTDKSGSIGTPPSGLDRRPAQSKLTQSL